MDANIDLYGWAEQMNRQQLSDRATRAWRAEEAVGHPATSATMLRRAAGRLLVRAGARLQGIPGPASVHSVAAPSASQS